MSGSAISLLFSRAILPNFQRSASHPVMAMKTLSKYAAVNSSARKCLSLQTLVRATNVESLRFTQFFRLFRDVCNSISYQRRFSSNATEEAQRSVEEKPAASKKTEISYDEFVTFAKSEGKYIIDVRDAAEIEETGMIPTAINVPLTKLKSSMLMSDAEFQEAYKVKKPTPDESGLMVFYGLSSVKSSAALELIHKMGYKKARHYPGGYEEWKHRQAAMKI